MKCFMAKKEDVQREWHVIDADGMILGRLAAKVAPILMGKTKPIYTQHVDTGDFVIVVNAEKIKVSGKKADNKQYEHYTGYPGGRRFVSFKEMLDKKPETVIEMAVRRMLPKNRLAKQMLGKLKVYRGPEHDHAAQQPQEMKL